MRHIFYRSQAVGLSTGDFDAIAEHAKTRNRERGVRSWLARDGRMISQIIEGPGIKVDALYRVIRDDPRHEDVILITRTDIAPAPMFDCGISRLAPYDLYMRSLSVIEKHGHGDTMRLFLDDPDYTI